MTEESKIATHTDSIDHKIAYMAMYKFLDDYYQLTKSEDIGGLLGSMSLIEDGNPADSAIWEEWLSAIDAAIHGQVNPDLKITK